MDVIRTQIRQFILDEFLPGETEGNLQDHMSLRESGILDSLGLLQVITFVESRFNIEVGPLDAGDTNFGTIDRVVHFVAARL
ncbi:MAG: acyl carrier protein [Deltaproteobacteria bacterium]|nr:acyl carrier protein [Deltaproteobacteria bacterium]